MGTHGFTPGMTAWVKRLSLKKITDRLLNDSPIRRFTARQTGRQNISMKERQWSKWKKHRLEHQWFYNHL